MSHHVHITPTAARTLNHIAEDSEKKWETEQTVVYLKELRDSFQYIADNHKTFPVKKEMTSNTNLHLHHVNKHYVVFKLIDKENVAIIAVLHERMDIPVRLKELIGKSREELAVIRARLHRR